MKLVHIVVHTLLKNDPLRPLDNSVDGNSFRLHPDVAVAFQHLLGNVPGDTMIIASLPFR